MGNFVRTLKSQNKMALEVPVIVILGCTGTGKSKLGIELAKRFNGEIISADSMQVYNGLDIITNKVTLQEKTEAIHHCMDFINPLNRYTVVDYQRKSLPTIDSILKNKKLPIIVGGTNYYIESLLWDVLIKSQDTDDELLFEKDKNEESFLNGELNLPSINLELLLKQKITQCSLDAVPSEVLHKFLQSVDPEMANMLHFNDRRKVIRSLQVYQQHGIKHSEFLKRQHSQKGGSSVSGPLRFKNVLMLWIQCEKSVLKTRLDDRVEDMIERGLVSELLDFHNQYNQNRVDNEKPSYTEGIFQSIGFKEFHNYLVLPVDERNSETGKKLLQQGIEELKLATKQYARKQEKWIVNRFLRKPDRQIPPVYGLDATDLTSWEKDVLLPAIEIVDSMRKNEVPKQNPLPLQESLNDVAETHYCDTCERFFVGRRVWEIHLKSKKHFKVKAALKKEFTPKKEILS